MFHISFIAPNATMVVYGILFGGTHPIHIHRHICLFLIIFFYRPKVDVLKLHEAANVLTGLHDFSAFTSPKSMSQNDPVKCLTVGVKRSTGILAHYQPKMADCFDFWEVHFHSQSFLYRQVMNMWTYTHIRKIRGKNVRSWCDGSSDQSFMVDPLSYFLFQPVLHNWCNKGRGM